MRQLVFSVLTLAVVSCCTPMSSPGAGHPHVVLLENVSTLNRGSGVVILDGWILTAAHNLPMTHMGDLELGEPLVHPWLDLALIPCEGVYSYGLEFAERPPELHDPLYSYGYWLGRQLQRCDGYQSDVTGQMSTPINPGCSGGAVVNERGELVGIIRDIGFIGVHDRSTGGYSAQHGVVIPQVAGYTLIDAAVIGWILEVTE